MTNNKPIILLFSAAWANKAIFKHQLTLLEQDYQVIEPNIHQFSSIHEIVNMVVTEYAKQNIAALIGLSMGGYIVLDLLVNHPNFCRKAILLGSSSLPLSDEVKNIIKNIIKEIEGGKALSAYSDLYAQSVLLPKTAANPAVRNLLNVMLQELGPTSCTNHHKACIAWQGHNETILKNLNVDLLAIAGDKDQAVSYVETQFIAKTVPNAEFALLEDAAHFSMLEQPEKVNELIINFLGK